MTDNAVNLAAWLSDGLRAILAAFGGPDTEMATLGPFGEKKLKKLLTEWLNIR